MKKEVICSECKKPILEKKDLAVVGKSFVPYHNECFNSIKHSNLYAFYSGYKINGPYTWIMLILFNVILWGAYFILKAPLDEVITFSLFILAMTLFFRGVSYLLYERLY